MAYQESFSQEDEDKKKEQMGATSSEQVLSQGSASTDQNPMASGPAAAKPQSRSGAWTNLTSYIDANKDQAEGMAGTVTSNIDNKATEAGNAGQSYATSVGDEVKKSTLDNTGFVNKVATAPGQVTSDEWAKATAGYQGPTSATGNSAYADVQGKVEKVRNSADTLTNASGRQQTVKDTFARPQGYTQGENTLDSFILGAGAGGKKLQDYQTGFKANNATSGWEGLIGGLGKDIESARIATDNSVKAAQGAVGGAIDTGMKTYAGAETQAAEDRKKVDANIESIQKNLFSPDAATANSAAAQFGLTPEQFEALRSQDPSLSALGNLTPNYRTAGDFAGDFDVAGLNNLLGITGKNPLAALTKSNNGGSFSATNSPSFKALADSILKQRAEETAAKEAEKRGSQIQAETENAGKTFESNYEENKIRDAAQGIDAPTPRVGTLATEAGRGDDAVLDSNLPSGLTITGGGDPDYFSNPNIAGVVAPQQRAAETAGTTSSLAPVSADPSMAGWLSTLINGFR